jgi:shikimate dehydrogenase
MISTVSLGLIGWSIGYTRSPDIYAALGNASGLTIEFEVLDVPEADLEASVEHFRTNGFAGFAVTIPYKTAVRPLLDTESDEARAVGAVNSVSIKSEQLYGANTDVSGFFGSLRGQMAEIYGRPVVVIGAGGSARAIVYGVSLDLGVGHLTVHNRTPERLAELVDWVKKTVPSTTLVTHAGNDGCVIEDIPEDALVINCTPLGGPEHPEESPFVPGFDWSRVGVYFDLNYNRDNRLVRSAREAGATAIDGSLMLVQQAVDSFALWTGKRLTPSAIHRQVFGAG